MTRGQRHWQSRSNAQFKYEIPKIKMRNDAVYCLFVASASQVFANFHAFCNKLYVIIQFNVRNQVLITCPDAS